MTARATGRTAGVTVTGDDLFGSLEQAGAAVPAEITDSPDTFALEVTYRTADPIKDPSPPVGSRMESGNPKGCRAPAD